ncbi:uncharacterized protein LOC100742743 isoform X1 [Bombus impatiens]|uniref:Uncharacterized protein LOC100742743 isoform X1 n=2 Tax=Bombus impatiens TaxID=132113 RepID=A0A6P6F8U7_BOMIM|nr:uncharacterized protein LOC100742743 isoform X1 [Bombus impatiens]
MSSVAYIVFLLATAVVKSRFTDICASKIYTLNVPHVVRNGTGPIDLSCIYNVTKDENGLVIKWYHNKDQIYQWIPPMPPQDIGVIDGFAEYPEQNLRHSNSQSIIHLKMAMIEMSGEYTCMISTFQEEDTKGTKMIIYVPETNLSIHVSSFNKSHLNLTCVANGAQPRPILKIYIEGTEVNNYYDKTVEAIKYKNILFATRSAIVKNPLEPLLLECEISIPHTDYKRRERIVYYPIQTLSQISNASSYKIGDVILIIYIVLLLKIIK